MPREGTHSPRLNEEEKLEILDLVRRGKSFTTIASAFRGRRDRKTVMYWGWGFQHCERPAGRLPDRLPYGLSLAAMGRLAEFARSHPPREERAEGVPGHERALLGAATSLTWQWARVTPPRMLLLDLQAEGVRRPEAMPEPWSGNEVGAWLRSHLGMHHRFWQHTRDFAATNLVYQQAAIRALQVMHEQLAEAGLPFSPSAARRPAAEAPSRCNLWFAADAMAWIEDQHAGALVWGAGMPRPELTADGMFLHRRVATPPITDATVLAVNALVRNWVTAHVILELLARYEDLQVQARLLREAAANLTAADLRCGSCPACVKR